MISKIVHIDDDIDIQELVVLALEEIGGLDVVQFSSGVEALEKGFPYIPDLILLDVMMPGLTGEETMLKLREIETLKHVPVIFMTAKGNQMLRGKLMDLGASGVIVKPFDPMTLAEELNKICARQAA